MSYVVLARRFRPQSLDQIIGQEHVSRTLKNAIAENRVAHAYLLSGPRGVGKTTTARILAKALNCKEGPTDKPCGKCPNCLEITAGNSVDVQEIDGASNRGIDEIRALRDNVKFAPAASKYKIYIIDEAHQITDAAFNALLKTLEEPPSHVVFILATTEPQKIPITILSRCQRYRFKLIPSAMIMDTLAGIVEKEGFQVDREALQVVAGAAGGSLRDSLSLLDQVVSGISGRITAEDVRNLLGFLPRELIVSVTQALAAEDMAKIMDVAREVSDQGYNLLQFVRDLREHLRRVMIAKVNPAILEVSDDEKKLLESQKDLFPAAWLIRSGHVLTRALEEMRWSDQPRLILELHLLKMAQPYANARELVDRLEKLEKNIPIENDRYVPPPAAPGHAVAERPAPVRQVYTPAPAPVPASAVKESAAPAEAAAPEVVPVHTGDDASLWALVVNEFKRSRPVVGSLLADAGFGGITGSNVQVIVANAFQQEGVKRNQAAIEEMLSARAGRSLALRVTLGKVEPQARAAAAPEPEEIVVPEEEESAPAPELFQVEGELKDSGELPPALAKIAKKFPGKITRNAAPGKPAPKNNE